MLSSIARSKDILRKFFPQTRDVTVNIDLNDEEEVAKLVKIYSTYQSGYCAVVILIKLSDAPDVPRIANIYGKFDAGLLGGSFNLPPQSSSDAPVVDMTIKQMSAYKADAAGAQFFTGTHSPPPCTHFNYDIMSMEVSVAGDISVKPNGWKTGDRIPYVLRTSGMNTLSIQELQNVAGWCKGYTAPAASASGSGNVAQPQVSTVETLSTPWYKNNNTWIGVGIAIGILVIGYFASKYYNEKVLQRLSEPNRMPYYA